MPMPIVLMLIKLWFCCLFISRKRVKGEKGDLHNNAPSLLNHSTPFSNTYFFSFPTHTLLFFLPITLPSHPHYNTSSLSLQRTFSPSLSLQHLPPSFSSHSNSTLLSPTHFPLLTLSHLSPPVEVENSVSG